MLILDRWQRAYCTERHAIDLAGLMMPAQTESDADILDKSDRHVDHAAFRPFLTSLEMVTGKIMF
jgi:hypothetical protein